MTPAMQSRLKLPIPPELDTRRSYILILANWETQQYVKTAQPASLHEGIDALPACYQAAEEQAKALWRMKYGADMPVDDVEMAWAETTFAGAIPYDGPTPLREEEQAIVSTDNFGDFTLDMLWLMVEGLGWRPGKPVAEDDPGWLAVWAEEESCGGYLDIVRAVLGMPETPIPTYSGWKPPAVLAAYPQETQP